MTTSATSSTSLSDSNKSNISFDENLKNSKIVCEVNNHEGQTRVKFDDSLPAMDKKEKRTLQRRRTPYAWDDKLRPVFDGDKKKKEKEGK